MIDEKTMQTVSTRWDEYANAGWGGKLALMRHEFEAKIDEVSGGEERLHIVIDGQDRRDYVIPEGGFRAFVKSVFEVSDGLTREYVWPGGSRWILSRKAWTILVIPPGSEDGFFIRFTVFRGVLLDALEDVYGWGYGCDITRLTLEEKDYEFLESIDTWDVFELVRFIGDGRTIETTDVETLLLYIDVKGLEDDPPDEEYIEDLRKLHDAVRSAADILEDKEKT